MLRARSPRELPHDCHGDDGRRLETAGTEERISFSSSRVDRLGPKRRCSSLDQEDTVMNRQQNATGRSMLDDPFTRRAALRGAGAVGVAALLGTRGIGRAVAQLGTPAASAIESYPEVVITATDYHLDLPARLSAGLTRLTLKNEGKALHDAMFMRVNEGATLAQLLDALTAPDYGPIFAAATSLGGPEVDAGLRATTIVDLTPGQYMVFCIIPDDTGMPHYLMGMQQPLEVTAPSRTEAAPVADVTVDLLEFGFATMPRRVAAGRQVWAVTNRGEQIHELLILRQALGVSFDDVRMILDLGHGITPEAQVSAMSEATPPMAEGVAPFTFIGGVAPMSPGQTNWAELELEPGEYFASCFLPDPATTAPHFALGMIMPLIVG
jgi:hypothetical protein